MNTSSQTTTVFFTGGPWDGDDCQFADPPDIVRVDGEMIAYWRYSKDTYRWGHQVTLTPAETYAEKANSKPATPEPSFPPKRKRGFLFKFFKYLGILFLIKIAIFLLVLLFTPGSNFVRPAPAAPRSQPAPVPALSGDELIRARNEEAFKRIEAARASATPASIDDRLKTLEEKNAEFLGHPAPTPDSSDWNQREQEIERQSLPVPRAQLAGPQKVVTMPYGERIVFHVKGTLPNQEALPLAGNAIGDAYQIGNDYFIWVTPFGGHAQWVDPVMSEENSVNP